MGARKNYFRNKGLVLAGVVGFGVAAVVGAAQLFAAKKPAVPPTKKVVAKATAGKAGAADPDADTEKKSLIAPADAKLVLAQVGDTPITVGDLAAELNRMSRYVRGRYQSVDKKRELLESLIEKEVLAKEAARRGFNKHPDVVRMLRQVMVQRLRHRVVQEKVKLTDISDADVKAYYDKHKDRYNKEEMIRAAHVLVKDEATAKKVLAEMRTAGKDPRKFRKLVNTYSIDAATKRRAGDLRYFTKSDKRLPKPLIDAAFALKTRGEIGGPIKTARGWHVLKLTHRRPALNRSLDDKRVKQQITTRLLRERRRQALEAFKAELRRKATVTVHDQKLAAVKVDTTLRRGRRMPFAGGHRGLGRKGVPRRRGMGALPPRPGARGFPGRRMPHGMMRRRPVPPPMK